MERQRLYNERVVAQPGQVRGANVVGPPAGHDWADNLLKTVAGAGSDIMRVIAHDYVRNENALMQEALISADTKFESWKQDYMKEHQGQSALDAQRVFVRKYGEIRQETMDMFQGHDNEIFRQRLDQSLGLRALHALQTGGAYQEQQDAAWQKSVFDGTLANFERDVQASPANEQYIAARRAEVVQDMQTRFKGEDLTARIAKLDEQIAEGRMNALLAAGDYDGAEKLLGGSGTAPAASSGGVPGSFTSSGGGTTSARNLSVHNYGNVKNIDGKFNAYASRHDGLMAIAERIKRYHEDPKRNAQSISDIIHIYAPKEDSNDPKGYAAFLGKRLGISPTSRLNFNDPKMVAGLVQGIAAMEHGAKKVSVGDDEALAAAQAVASGQMPKVVGRAPAKWEAARTQAGTQAGTTGTSSLPGLSPEKVMAFRHRIDMIRKSQQAELRAGMEMTIADYVAAAQDGKAGDLPFTSEQVAAGYGDKADKVWAQITEAKQLSSDISRMNDSDAATIGGILKAAEPAGEGYVMQRGFQQKRQEAAKAILEARQKDPSGYLMNRNKNLQTAYNEMLKQPTPETVNAYLAGLKADADLLKLGDVPIFPKDQAKAFAGVIMSSPDPGMALQNLQASFGQYWPKAMQELCVKDGLPMSAQLAANNMPREAAKLLMDGAKDKDFQKNAFEIHKDSFARTDFDAEVNKQMGEFNATLLGGGDQSVATEVNNSVATLALQYVNRQNLDYKDAIRKAAHDVILDRYTINSVNGGSFRVPTSLDGDAIERGAGKALEELAAKSSDLYAVDYKHLGEHAPKMYGSLLKAAGRWQTAGDESGLVLFMGGNVVRDKDGKPITRTWAELGKLSKDWQEREERQGAALEDIYEEGA